MRAHDAGAVAHVVSACVSSGITPTLIVPGYVAGAPQVPAMLTPTLTRPVCVPAVDVNSGATCTAPSKTSEISAAPVTTWKCKTCGVADSASCTVRVKSTTRPHAASLASVKVNGMALVVVADTAALGRSAPPAA